MIFSAQTVNCASSGALSELNRCNNGVMLLMQCTTGGTKSVHRRQNVSHAVHWRKLFMQFISRNSFLVHLQRSPVDSGYRGYRWTVDTEDTGGQWIQRIHADSGYREAVDIVDALS